MRAGRLVLCLGLAFVLAACGRQESASRNSPGTAPAPAMRAGTTHGAGQQQAAEQASDLPSKITRMNEDGSETVEDVPSDSGAHNPLLAAVASTVAASTTQASAATSGTTQWQEGVNYTRLVPAQPTAAPSGQVEVLEFFWYACPHCAALEPMIESWKKTMPAYISFSPVPVMWSEGHRSLARLYYTLQSLGQLDRLHGEVFKEIQEHNDPLIGADPANTAEAERLQTAFAVKSGISEADFKKAYHSMSVDMALQRADQLVQRYRIDGVPTFVVNGKYIADVRSADGAERLLSLVGDLAAQEHKH